MKDHSKEEPITVIGLGQMGIKIAELLRDNGNPVTTWNRTAARAQGIGGVKYIESIGQAIRESAVAVICVFDYQAITEIFGTLEDKAGLKGKTFINLTTGNLQEAEDLDRFFNHHGAQYLDGALQVAPDQMGLPDTTILMSGDQNVYNQQEKLIKILGGNVKYLGAKISAAAAMDLATLGWLYGSYAGLIHGAALITAAGLNLSSYSDIIAEITPGFTSFFRHELEVIQSADFTISQSPLSISVPAVERISNALKASGLDNGFHEKISLLLNKAVQLGHGRQELAVLIKAIQQPELSGGEAIR